jgi:hypothetical protein
VLEDRLAPAVVTTAVDEFDYNPAHLTDWAGPDGQLSLREAINEINVLHGGAITFAAPMTIAIDLNLGPLPEITSPMTISGGGDANGNPNVVLNGNGLGFFGLLVHSSHSVIRNMVIENFNSSGMLISEAANCSVQHCYFGTNSTGTAKQGNLGEGITLEDATACVIRGNLLSGNGSDGIGLDGTACTRNRIVGNAVGVDITGQNALGNGANGVWLGDGAHGNLIAGNLISDNGLDGVVVTSGAGNAIVGNSIFANGNMGIELTGNGNHLMPAPVLISAVFSVIHRQPTLTLLGRLSGRLGYQFRLDLYANAAAANAEGQTFLGYVMATVVDRRGHFIAKLKLRRPATEPFLTATATDGLKDTSEFSAELAV